jgi:hypothetical protein
MATLGPKFEDLKRTVAGADYMLALGYVDTELRTTTLKDEMGHWVVRGNFVYSLHDAEYVSHIVTREADELLSALRVVDPDEEREEACDMLAFELLPSVALGRMSPNEVSIWESLPIYVYRAMKVALVILSETPTEDIVALAHRRVRRYMSRGYVKCYIPRDIEDSDCVHYLLMRIYATVCWMELLMLHTKNSALRAALRKFHNVAWELVKDLWRLHQECAGLEDYRRRYNIPKDTNE